MSTPEPPTETPAAARAGVQAPSPPSPAVVDHLATATRSLVRTVDGLSEEDLRAASGLPQWSRGHVVAHLALNAEGLAGVLRALALGEDAAMYRSTDARDADIEELAGREPSVLRDRLLGAVTGLSDALGAVPGDRWDARARRTPDARATLVARDVPLMRLREVTLHHADLEAGHTRADWDPDAAEVMAASLVARAEGPCRLHAVDRGRTWTVGDVDSVSSAPTVAGTAADLVWWLSGRGSGEGLQSDSGTLPRTGAW